MNTQGFWGKKARGERWEARLKILKSYLRFLEVTKIESCLLLAKKIVTFVNQVSEIGGRKKQLNLKLDGKLGFRVTPR